MRATAVPSSFYHGNSCYDNQCCNITHGLFNLTILKMAELEINNSDEIVQKVKNFMWETCGYALGLNGHPCSDQFTEETVLYNLNNCLELSSTELDLVILANIQVFTERETLGHKRSRSPRWSSICLNGFGFPTRHKVLWVKKKCLFLMVNTSNSPQSLLYAAFVVRIG